jgi:tyrosine-protein kinase Etk/Wzc
MVQNEHPREIDLLDYAKILWRRRVLLFVLCSVSVVLTMAVGLLLPKYYRSDAVILAIAPESGGLSAALASNPLAGALAGPLGGLSSPADRILVYLKSRTIADKVVRRFDLLRVFNESKWDAAKSTWKDPGKPPLMEDAVKKLETDVTKFKKSREGAITITVEWKDPKLAADIANYYVSALAEFMKDRAVTTTVQTVDAAVPAERKSSPRIALNMVIAGIMSLLFGVFLAIVLERLSPHKR